MKNYGKSHTELTNFRRAIPISEAQSLQYQRVDSRIFGIEDRRIEKDGTGMSEEHIVITAISTMNKMHSGEIDWNEKFYWQMANIATLFSKKMEREDQ